MIWKDIVPFRKKSVPIKRGNGHTADRLRDETQRLFSDFFSDFSVEPFNGGYGTSFSPHIDVAETDREIKVYAELPGMDDKDIELNLNRDSLVIRGEKKEDREDKGKDYYHVERSYGAFSRSIPLSVEVESEKAEAHFKKGVLTVTIPKSAKALETKKKIPIRVE